MAVPHTHCPFAPTGNGQPIARAVDRQQLRVKVQMLPPGLWKSMRDVGESGIWHSGQAGDETGKQLSACAKVRDRKQSPLSSDQLQPPDSYL